MDPSSTFAGAANWHPALAKQSASAVALEQQQRSAAAGGTAIGWEQPASNRGAGSAAVPSLDTQRHPSQWLLVPEIQQHTPPSLEVSFSDGGGGQHSFWNPGSPISWIALLWYVIVERLRQVFKKCKDYLHGGMVNSLRTHEDEPLLALIYSNKPLINLFLHFSP